MKVAKAEGRLRGKPPKLSPPQEAHLVPLHKAGQHTIAELFNVGRSTVYRAIERDRTRIDAAAEPDHPLRVRRSMKATIDPNSKQREVAHVDEQL